ncbi:MAG: hypothetical protein K2N84_03055 [Clostridia bacterium]|nr:hypothetical protein [Clostridia bacterium]
MEKLAFADGEKIGVFDGEKVTLYESAYIKRYREYAETRVKNNEWKHAGEGALFRGDNDPSRTHKEKVDARINGVEWDGDKVVYSFCVNDSSGVYRKDVSDEKAPEEHILSSSEESVFSLHRADNTLAVTVSSSAWGITSQIGTLNTQTSELKTLTDGDSRDANAFFSPVKNTLLFDSAGVGRDSDGEFTGKYSPSIIYGLDLASMEIEEVYKDEKLSYFKPKQAADGTLYCIQRPTKEKKGGNLFLDILLLPVRLFQAIAMFLQSFVMLFTGKSLTSGGDNPAKGRESNSRKLFVDGNLIEVEKEFKRNKKYKNGEYGFIPMSWKLVKIVDGKAEPIKSGICDFALCADGGLYCTNGRHIYYVKDGNTKKIADTERCLCLATQSVSTLSGDLFGF